jgi:beta-N-acetylhexosaminidase
MRITPKIFLWFLICLPLFSNGQQIDPLAATKAESHQQQKWVDSVYQSLSLYEKVGQLFMPMVFSEQDSSHYKLSLNLVKTHKVGGLIFSLGGPVEQSQWLNNFQSLAKTPLLIAMDAEWGVAMRLDSIKPFPWPMTLGAVKDTSLLRAIGNRMGEQEKRLGIHYSFSPVLDINTNSANPIIGNRSFGSSKELVIRQATAIMKGHHQAGILTSGKHFPGHGDTSQDSHKTLPTISFSAQRIDSIELAPYRSLIKEGLSSVMVAHLNIPSISNQGLPSSLSKDIIQGLLKDSLNFRGLIVTDALNMKGVSEYSKVENIDLTAFLAGHDLLLISNDIPKGIKAIVSAYRKGKVTKSRLEYSVKKILKAKYKVGLAEYKPVNLLNLYQDLNTVKDQRLYSESIGDALTLLRNENNILPLKNQHHIAHIALGDDSAVAFNQQLQKYQSIPLIKEVTVTNVLEKTKAYDTLVISFHRSNANPWKASDFNSRQLNIISKTANEKTVILDIFVKPYALKPISSIKGIDAIIMSYQNSVEAQQLSADAIFGAQHLIGKLPVKVSNIFKAGDGIDLQGGIRLGYAIPESLGFNSAKLKKIDALAEMAIDSVMTPGMQIIAVRKGKIIYEKNIGFHTYKKEQPVQSTDLYDIASLTKILGTLPLVMKEVASGTLTLSSTIATLLPEWKESNKSNISLKQMLSHYAQLWPWIPFYKETLNKKGYPKRTQYKKISSIKYASVVAKDLFIKNNFENKLYTQIKESKLTDSLQYKYSDLPYYILKKYFESSNKLPYDVFLQKEVFDPLGLTTIGYRPLDRFEASKIIPSEVDDYFRHKELRGYVHDMGAAMQNGVGGHAGLFSNAQDVAAIMQMYLQEGRYNGIQLLQPETINLFNTCYYCEKGNRRGVGFDKPDFDLKNSSTCGCVSKRSFGHSGYTGTYAWADPDKEIIIVILANRTYPNDDMRFSKSNIRTRIQALLYEALIN